jgi:hypothetical protein
MNKSISSVILESEQGQPVKPPDMAARWRKVLEDQRISGLPISVFCRQRGIPQSSLFAWRRRLAGVGRAFQAVKIMAEPAASRLSSHRAGGDGAAVEDDGAAAGGAIELCLPGDRRLLVRRGFDRGLLADLIEALEALS